MRGGKREGAGRPKGSLNTKPVRDIAKQTRWSAGEWDSVVFCADKAGVNISSFIRHRVLGDLTSQKLDRVIRQAWYSMKARCENSNTESFKNYGAVGISVCQEWQDYDLYKFWVIANGFRSGLTVGRIDHDKGYSPDNCTIQTKTENSHEVCVRRNNLGDDFDHDNLGPKSIIVNRNMCVLELTVKQLAAVRKILDDADISGREKATATNVIKKINAVKDPKRIHFLALEALPDKSV